MHDPVLQTGEWLKSVVQGYFNYYAVPGNLKKPRGVPGPTAGTVVARTSPPEPTASILLDPHAYAGQTMASSTASAPSLSR